MAPKKNYTQEQMQNAVEAVNKGEKVAIAATKFGVPRITLYNKISGKSPLICSMGPATYLTKEDEDVLEKWIIDMNNKHIPITKDELLDSVQRIITDKNKETPFNNNRPGKKWYNLFLKRHPIISERTAQNLTTARDNVCEEDIEKWFKEVEDYLRNNALMSVLKEPERVFNTDESAFFLSPKPGKVLAQRGEKHIYSSSSDEKENLTVLITGNAAGQLAPPMVVFSYERIPSTIAASFPHDWAIGKSQTGWMCGSTFYEYIANIFHPWLVQQNIKTPVLFFLDGHKSHLTLHLSNFCVEHGIEVITLNPNSTHILQPMDLAVFRPLKASWKKAVTNWKMHNLGQNLKKEHFAPVLKTALQTLTADTIRNGFRAAGLCHFGSSYVDLTKIKSHRSQQGATTTDNTQKYFLQHLEKEITSVFRREKLDLFKELYYKNRNELDNRLPPEDTSLYVIWASIKQSVAGSNQTNEASAIAPDVVDPEINEVTLPDLDQIGIADNEPHVKTLRTDKLSIGTPNPSVFKDINTTNLWNDSIEEPSTSRQATAIIQKDPNIRNNNFEATALINFNPRSFHEIETSGIQDVEYAQSVSQPNKMPIEIHTPGTSRHDGENDIYFIPPVEKTPSKEPLAPSLVDLEASKENTNKIGTLQTISGVKGNIIIPSPFKRNLFWPDEDDIQKGKKRRLKEKIPSVVTSQAWIKYHQNKESQKRLKLEEKERRAKERTDKKLLKETLNKQNKKKKDKSKRKEPDGTSSDETDAEIEYAESDDSYSDDTYLAKFKKTQPEKYSSSESEDLPLSKSPQIGNKLSKGNFVIIKYEGEHFPGVIENVDKGSYEISTMTFSKGNTFRWPKQPDKIWYTEKDFVESIDEPVLSNKRGFYVVKEMNKYLPFVV